MPQPQRSLPAVHRFLDDPAIAAFEPSLGHEAVKAGVRSVLAARRAGDSDSDGVPFETLRAAIVEALELSAARSLRHVINATGILLHTNLGRAPLAASALAAVAKTASGYSNLEYDLAQGRRGSRYDHATGLIAELTGAQGALVVNNCAAAVLLILDSFAKGREVVIARGQLIEIGGGFRLPEVLERSGAQLIEVGATNKVSASDYRDALSVQTAMLLRSHPSNFRISGFVAGLEPNALAGLAHAAGVLAVEDLGSGAIVDLREYGLPHERTVQDAIAGGFDLVAFSGDKLLGGPQAGIIAGSSAAIARLRSNPLLRALRVDKMTLAALEQTLRLYASGRREEIPLYAMLGASRESLMARADRYRKTLDVEILPTRAYLGAGSLPEDSLESVGVALSRSLHPGTAVQQLRRADPPIAARIQDDRVILDLRTIAQDDDERVIALLAR